MTREFDAGGPSPRDRFCRDEALDSLLCLVLADGKVRLVLLFTV
jgi:hypothetical protein